MTAAVIAFPARPAPIPPREVEEMVTITIRKELWLTLKALGSVGCSGEIAAT